MKPGGGRFAVDPGVAPDVVTSRGVNIRAARRALRWSRAQLHLVPELPYPWDVNKFIERLAESRGREIVISPVLRSDDSEAPAALWYEHLDFDEIRIDERDPDCLDRDNCIVHEASHMIAGHRGVVISESGSQPEPGASPGDESQPSSIRVLHRSHYADYRELQAETLAFSIWEAAGARLFPDGDVDAARLVGAFEYRLGRAGEGW